MNVNVLKTESNAEIDNLHKKIPEVKDKDWIQWKKNFAQLNDKVWQMINNMNKSAEIPAKIFAEKPGLALNETNFKLDALIADDRTFLIANKRREFNEDIRLYYFYSILLIAGVQFFSSDSRPSIPELDLRIKELNGENVIDWIKGIHPHIKQIYTEILELHSTLSQWPINTTSLTETQDLLNKVDKYKGYSAWLVNVALKSKKVEKFMIYYADYTPHLYNNLCIQKRYLNIVSTISLSLSSGKKYTFDVKTRPEFENNLWFEFLIIIYILFWMSDYIFTFSRLFLRFYL